MACPSADVMERLNYLASSGGAPLTPEQQACYAQLMGGNAAYVQQYGQSGGSDGSATNFVQMARNNPDMLVQPQPGTTPVTNPSLISTIFGLLGRGATEYQKHQLLTQQAKMGGQAMFVDPNLAAQAQAAAPSSRLPLILGAGAGVLLLVGLVAYMASKD